MCLRPLAHIAKLPSKKLAQVYRLTSHVQKHQVILINAWGIYVWLENLTFVKEEMHYLKWHASHEAYLIN